jgi:hypothetical protein
LDIAERNRLRPPDRRAAAHPAQIEGTPSLSGNGRFLAYLTPTDKVFVRRLGSERRERVDIAPPGEQFECPARLDGDSTECHHFVSFSDDGRSVSFDTWRKSSGRLDIGTYVRDRRAKTTVRVDVGSRGQKGSSAEPSMISKDGRYVAFTSDAPLVAGDDVFGGDTFLHGPLH